jgi:hypothetical protein
MVPRTSAGGYLNRNWPANIKMVPVAPVDAAHVFEPARQLDWARCGRRPDHDAKIEQERTKFGRVCAVRPPAPRLIGMEACATAARAS